MPTFTTIALESLLEPKIRDSYKTSTKSVPHFSSNDKRKKEMEEEEQQQKLKKKASVRNRVNILPALYITPEPTPILHSVLDSLSPSPYVVNRKGRGGKSVNRRVDGIEVEDEKKKDEEGERDLNGGGGKSRRGELRFEEVVNDKLVTKEIVGDRIEDFGAEDDFLDTRCDSLSVGSSGEVNDLGTRIENLSVVSNLGEFFDADDDFSSDESISNALYCGQSIESEMRSTRLALLEEIEKRKTAEDALGLMYNEWGRVSNLLSAQTGLRFPSPPNASSMKLEIDSIEQFSQEVFVARFVSEAIGKGLACAKVESAAKEIIKTKDQEISRLRDRLQYYEVVNNEMSQRNQEVIQIARRQRLKKKGLQRWLWSGIGLSIAIGVSVIAYSCLPQTSANESLLTSIDSSDASCISSSDSTQDSNHINL